MILQSCWVVFFFLSFSYLKSIFCTVPVFGRSTACSLVQHWLSHFAKLRYPKCWYLLHSFLQAPCFFFFYLNKNRISQGKKIFTSNFGAELILVCVNADNLPSVKMLQRKKPTQAATFVWSHQNSSLCLYFQSPRGGLQAHTNEWLYLVVCVVILFDAGTVHACAFTTSLRICTCSQPRKWKLQHKPLSLSCRQPVCVFPKY